jgi:hypothetical protein
MENGRLDETRLVLLQCPRPTDVITHLYLYQPEIDEVHKCMYVALGSGCGLTNEAQANL